MESNIIKYLPYEIRKYLDYQVITSSEDPEFTGLYESSNVVLNESFIVTANDEGIRRFEKMLGITPSANDTLEDRRLMILTRYNIQTPYTERRLREILSGLLGESGYSLDVNHNEYQIEVTFHNIRNVETIYKLLKVIIPANMLYTYVVRVIPESPDITITNVPVISSVDTVFPIEASKHQLSENDILCKTYSSSINRINVYPVEADRKHTNKHNLQCITYSSSKNHITVYPIEVVPLQQVHKADYIDSYSKVHIKIKGGIK